MVGNIQREMPSREALGAFASALRRLVRTKTFEQISVRAIVKESGLSSRTFYNHFRSKYDLVFWRYAAADWANLGERGTLPTFLELFMDGLRRLEADRALFQDAFRDRSGPESLCMTLVRHGVEVIPDYIKRRHGAEADWIGMASGYDHDKIAEVGWIRTRLQGEIQAVKGKMI